MSNAIYKKIEELEGFGTPTLRDCWEQAFGRPAPKRISRDLLLRALAYRMQEQIAGGLSAATRRRLARSAAEVTAGQVPSTTPSPIKPGTRLLREWQGVTHEVIVLEDGVQYRGETRRSLSAVAREITGARWSGPLFFGLKSRHES